MREITGAELFAATADPFVHHQIDARLVDRAWQHGGALVIQGGRPHRPAAHGPFLVALGAADDLAPLLEHVDRVLGRPPGRFIAEDQVRPLLPRRWRFPEIRTWTWMLTGTEPTTRPTHPVEETSDSTEIDAILDVAMPSSHARPGSPGVEAWLGVRDDGRLRGVGALERLPDGTGHLRGISVLPEARGSGIGHDLSHALTVRALDGASGMATLGVYSDNTSAIRLYERLGYTERHRFCSGGRHPAGTLRASTNKYS